jgi:hypothetical protein
MARRKIWTWAIGLALGGCDDGADTDTDTDRPAAGPENPTVQVSPAEGAVGVLAEAPIVLTFSEPMNTASVHAAWSSLNLPAEALNFSWNPAGTVLTVDASGVLEHQAGDQNVMALGYDFSLQINAVDAEGDPLASPFTTWFDTARDVTMVIPASPSVPSGTGSFDGTASTDVLRVGDSASNTTWRAFTTFDLSSVPEGVVRWEEAVLAANQASVEGAPYEGLGGLIVGVVRPFQGIAAPEHAAALVDELAFSSTSEVGDPAGDRAVGVASAIEEALDGGAGAVTFRFGFSTPDDGDGSEDAATLEGPTLTLRLLAE